MMNNIYRSATIKLTAWYLALVLTISLAFSVVVYHFATDTLARSLNRQEARIYREFPVFTNNPFFTRTYDVQAGSQRILLDLVYFNVIVVVTAGFASYWLAKKTLEPIEQSNQHQKRFVADASHELRTPLTALRTNTEVALLDPQAKNSDLRAALQSNLEDIDTLSTLLANLMRISQLEMGAAALQITSLSSSSLIEGAVRQVKVSAQSKQIKIECSGDNTTLIGDRDCLTQLFVIFLDNAIKYSPERSVISVTTTSNEQQKIITIVDHGIGIDAGALPHIFEPFYRGDKARSSHTGYGLGLSIAKHIADIHHATISLTSASGKGTTVNVIFPKNGSLARNA